MAAAAARRTAKENVPMHWVQRASWLALQFREPAVRVCGDLRTAVANGALAVGCYCLLVGCAHLNQTLGWERNGVDYIEDTSWIIACIIATIDAALYYACKKLKNGTHLEYILCATMALYLIDVPFSIISYVSAIVTFPQGIEPLWLTLRIALFIFHLCLVYCLLVELRENKDPSQSPVLQPTSVHHSTQACDNIPKKEEAESGVLAPP